MRKRKARRRAAGTCASILVESKPNARWVKFHGRSVPALLIAAKQSLPIRRITFSSSNQAMSPSPNFRWFGVQQGHGENSFRLRATAEISMRSMGALGDIICAMVA